MKRHEGNLASSVELRRSEDMLLAGDEVKPTRAELTLQRSRCWGKGRRFPAGPSAITTVPELARLGARILRLKALWRGFASHLKK